ncbi:MAG: hypothetical protein JST28_00560 [Acidobacteria bacterium]|nr:hypothetical protein [Acidobacteriota bacterium]
MKRGSRLPGFWWCAIASAVDLGIIVYIAAAHWNRIGNLGLLLFLIAAGVLLSFTWAVVLSQRVQEAISDSSLDPEGNVEIEQPLRQASALVYHGPFFGLCAVGVALVWIDKLVALRA